MPASRNQCTVHSQTPHLALEGAIARYTMPKQLKNGLSLPEIPHPLCPSALLRQTKPTDSDQKKQESSAQLE
eukprot:3412716-Rhodomonas_salina.1